MKKAIIYQKEECVIIRNIILSNKVFAFFVALDSKKIIYLKENIYNNNVTYASLDKMIQSLKEYQVPSVFNIKILLDTFINTINYRIRNNIITDSDEIIEMIIQFEKIVKDPYIVQMTNVNCNQIFNKEAMYQVTNAIKKIDNKVSQTGMTNLITTYTDESNDVFTSQNWLEQNNNIDNKQLLYESINKSNKAHRKSPIDFLFNNKILNIYMIIMVVAVITFASCLNIISKWAKESSTYEQDIEELEEEGLVVDPDLYVVSNTTSNTKSNTTSNTKSNSNKVSNKTSNKTSNKVSNKTSNSNTASVKTYKDYPNITLLQPDFTALKKKNFDTIAWIYISNASISFPVVYSDTGNYYHTHDFNKNSTTSGWIYADYRTDFKSYKRNNVIYGHGVSTRFGNLSKLFEKSWYSNKNNHYIKLSTPTEDTLWRVVSVYTDKDSKYPVSVNFENDELFKKWAETEVGKSKVKFDYKFNKNDKFLTLKTCKGTGSKRIFVHAVLVTSQKK